MTAYRAPEQDVILSSRVRLARNYQDVPFVSKMNTEWADETIARASDAVMDDSEYVLHRILTLSDSERKRLVEHHLVSYDLLKFEAYSAALVSSGKTISIMVNEEDHLRIQGLLPGEQLAKAADLAFSADEKLGATHPFAFDEQWGYLTGCPTNTGTGMRASLMMHLPALSASGKLSELLQAFSKLGLTVRGLYGEGSEAKGHLYQLSNQVTLGRSEEDMIEALMAAASQIADRERTIREKIKQHDEMQMLDKLMRSVGLMGHARLMDGAEFMQRYSDLRTLGAMGIVNADLSALDQLMMDLQPGSLNVRAGGNLSEHGQRTLRAELLRQYIETVAAT